MLIREPEGLVPYEEAWAEQQRIHSEVVAGAPDVLLLLQHPPVFTAGRRTQPEDRPWDGSPVVEVDRGGRITWHGPGQIVGYPILRLPEPIDVVAHVRRMEEAVIRTCADLGLATGRVEGRSGVWVGDQRKIAAIGVRVSRGVTMHGFALNVDCDLSWFARIVPCGLSDASATSVSAEIGPTSMADVLPRLRIHVSDVLGAGGSASAALGSRT